MSDAGRPPTYGRYVVRESLGSGAFATVFRAYDPTLDADVALKVLADNWASNADVRERFIREARVLRRLRSERLVAVHDVAETDDGRPFVVMSLAERGTLETRERTTPQPTAHDLWFAITELAACLQVVHGGSIIHRDIKPSNILIVDRRTSLPLPDLELRVFRRDDQLILGDFGLARDLSSQGTAASLGGTPGFMAPEQLERYGRPDARADLYGATAVILSLLTRAIAPSAMSPESVRAVLSDVAARVPPEFAEEVIRNLDADPARRASDASAWSAALVRSLHAPGPGRAVGPPPSLVPPSPAPATPAIPVAPSIVPHSPTPSTGSFSDARRPSLGWIYAGAAAAVVVVVALAWLATRGYDPPAASKADPPASTNTTYTLPHDYDNGWSERAVPSSAESLFAVASSPLRSVAVGEKATIIVSDDHGLTWTSSTALPDTGDLDDVATDGKQWVIVGKASEGATVVLRSPDAKTWTGERIRNAAELRAIATNGATWVAAGRNGAVLTSPDADDWTIRPVPPEMAGNTVYDVTHDGKLWIAVGSNNLIATSEDAVTWTVRNVEAAPPTTAPVAHALNGVAGNGAGYLAVGGEGQLFHSLDGITWTPRSVAASCSDVVWNGELYMISARDGMWQTTDATQVTRAVNTTGIINQSISAVDKQLIIVGETKSGVTPVIFHRKPI